MPGPESTARAVWSDFCAVAPSPEAAERLRSELDRVRSASDSPLARQLGLAPQPRRLGFDDGVIIPPSDFPPGTPAAVLRSTALQRAPLQGTVRVIVVLVDFSDRVMAQTAAHFDDLFFSTGVLPNGSVKEYYHEVTGGLVDLVGQTVGPLRLPQTLAWYTNNNFGIGRPTGTPRANIFARDAAMAADLSVNFTPYDNDGNGFVDAFVIVHAGGGGEATLDPGDIWSHKWVLPSALTVDTTKIFAYLTIPEDAKIGVCAHELGHLLFGFPDLYDIDDTSEGVGNWCLMAGGSWGGGGDVPVHPSAWCKINQGWAAVTNVTTAGALSLPDVKVSKMVHRLWKDGASGPEYFLLENRQQSGYDASLPAGGLLIWHVDEAQPDNSDENHYKVALVQADGKRDLELSHNRGDGGDPYPGSSGNTTFDAGSTPNSKSYSGQASCVAVTGISASGATMTVTAAVSCAKSPFKELKDSKDLFKDLKEPFKERKDARDGGKSHLKDLRDGGKNPIKDLRDGGKNPLKDAKDARETPSAPNELTGTSPDALLLALTDLDERVRALEGVAAGGAEPFITGDLRPDLLGGPSYGGDAEDAATRMAAADPAAKRGFDSPPPR
jgi:immune inhibitor A